MPLLRSLRHAILAAVAVAAVAAENMTNVHLIWKPTSTVLDYGVQPINLMQFEGIKIAVLPFTDSRADKALMGENRESAAVKTVTTQDNVAAFATEHAIEILKGLAFPISEDAAQARFTLTGEIIKFNVVERETYQGEVRIKLSILSGNQLVWKGLIMGRASRFGRSYKLENYFEVLSDSLLEAVARMAMDETFLQVLAGKATVVPTQPAAPAPAAAPAPTSPAPDAAPAPPPAPAPTPVPAPPTTPAPKGA